VTNSSMTPGKATGMCDMMPRPSAHGHPHRPMDTFRGGAHMTRVLMLVVLVVAVTTTLAEARAHRIHVTAKIVQTTVTGDPDHPKIGDQIISSVVLLDEHETHVGTGTGVCTLASLPPLDTLVQCLLTTVFAEGQLIFGGVAPLPEVGAVAHFGILGGTDDFRKARGDVTIVVITPELQDVIFDLK
jgi:hypothetical protein